jgi:DUF971 family protein
VTPATTPTRLHLKKDERLEIDWADGRRCVYPVTYLRSMCPCAQCRTVRQGEAPAPPASPPASAPAGAQASGQAQPARKKPVLTILPGNYARPLHAVAAEPVGNYGIKIEWSDNHGSGIYSFQYLREICPAGPGDRPVQGRTAVQTD